MSSQPGKVSDLDGSAPDTHPAALLLVDLVNAFDYPDGDQLLANAAPIAPSVRALKARARAAGIPAIYVNDNFGKWRSNFQDLLQRCLQGEARGCAFVQQLAPDEQDYFVLKPKHSGFYQTPLDVLLKHLGTKRLILTGLTTNSCVLFTGHDAYMRDLELYIPSDCVAAHTAAQHEYGMEQMRNVLKAHTSVSNELDLDALSVV